MLTQSKIVHIHPTRLCNFKCLHCYSKSGPEKHPSLDADSILDATAKLQEFGYRNVSLSGGEPTLYPQLERLCEGLFKQNYVVSLITNGWNVRRLQSLASQGFLHSTTVSFDGLETLHDRIRLRKGAFRAALTSVGELQTYTGKVGAIIAVTYASLPQLPDLVDTLADAGVTNIQFHPVAAQGRANEQKVLDLSEIEPEALARLLIMTNLFAKLKPEIDFSCDAIFGQYFSRLPQVDENGTISPLVIDEEGAILPFVHGINSNFKIGSLGSPLQPPLPNEQLRGLLKDTADFCSDEIATTYYPELVRRSFH